MWAFLAIWYVAGLVGCLWFRWTLFWEFHEYRGPLTRIGAAVIIFGGASGFVGLILAAALWALCAIERIVAGAGEWWGSPVWPRKSSDEA